MTPFDDQFADRVREAFDAYEEPVDEAALERMRAALGHVPAADRGPVASRTRRRRWAVTTACAALLVASALWAGWPNAPDEPVRVAAAPLADPGPDVRSAVPRDAAPRSGRTEAPVEVPAEPEPALSVPDAPPTATPPARRRPSRPGTSPAETPPAAVPSTRPDVLLAEVDEGPGDAAPPAPTPVVPVDAPAVAVLPVAPPVFVSGNPRPVAPPGHPAAEAPERSVLRLVVATTTAFTDGWQATGVGVAAGVVREWHLARGVALSGGALVASNRFETRPQAFTAAQTFSTLQETGEPIDVPAQSALTTLALEVPVDVAVDLAAVPSGRVGVSVGLTSALYVAQTFRDEGQTYSGQLVADPAGGEPLFVVSSEPFEARESLGALSRLEVARQLNLSLGYTTDARTLAVDVVARLPLGGLTSRDVRLTTLGVRLRVGLP